MLNTQVYRAICLEPECDDGTGQPFNAKVNFASAADAASALRQHWGDAHAAAHVIISDIPADFR